MCFHAGDGNIHPIVLFDERDTDQCERVEAVNMEILSACAEAGGTITGEHGIGVEKMDYMPLIFSPEDLAVMVTVKEIFNPSGLCNPGKNISNRRIVRQTWAITVQNREGCPMKYWSQVLQLIIVTIVAIGIGCAPPASTPEAAPPAMAESTEAEAMSAPTPKMDTFDQSDGSLFTVEAPHKNRRGNCYTYKPDKRDTVLLSSVESSTMKEYTVTAEVIPPNVGESVGIAFAVRGKSSQILFYVYRPAGADPYGKTV